MRKSIVLIVFLLSCLTLHPQITLSQPSTQPSVCEYQKTRNPVPINPKTNKPYMPAERNQEPIAGASIPKDDIKKCLQTKTPIENHYIVFEDYRDAWQELAKETGDYTIPLLIEGGVLHANTPYDNANTSWDSTDDTGGIRFGEFRDPTVKDTSKLTEEEQKRFGIKNTDKLIALIRSRIDWKKVFIDSAVSVSIVESKDTHAREDNFSFIFINITNFGESTFSKGANFGGSVFRRKADFSESTFSKGATFNGCVFSNESDFYKSNFSDIADFSVSTFNNVAYLKDSTFDKANFSWSKFKKAFFSKSKFNTVNFSWSNFSKVADFGGIIVEDKLIFDNASLIERGDFRDMSAKELSWDSTIGPSNVQGVVDMREAYIGSAIIKEVRFQDLMDLSRSTFGQYKVIDTDKKAKIESHTSEQILFENNTFENEADFLLIKFNAPTVFINNRFRRTLDLTGATFESQNSQAQNSRLCLSFNRINRLVFEPEHLGNPPGIDPYQQFMSLFAQPLLTSRVRQIGASECMLTAQTASNPGNATQDEEPLDDIYKTLEKSFREANDRTGINEAWYLEILAERERQSRFWAGLSWLFGDVPSRYTVDVWRTVSVSIGIMILFYLIYFIEFKGVLRLRGLGYYFLYIMNECPRKGVYHTIYENYREKKFEGKLQIPKLPKYPEKYKAFRLRLFEPIHSEELNTERTINPWTDSALLSMRSFLNLGLGATYPNTKRLRRLTTIEWGLGIFMLIHFIWAVKNNLPAILPFLGTVN